MTARGDIHQSITACRADLARTADDLKWAMEPGLSPEGKALDAPRGTALQPIDLDDTRRDEPDYVPGPRYALDIGDPKLRLAFLRGVEFLALAEVRLVFAVAALGTNTVQPKPVCLNHDSSFRLIDTARVGMERRLTLIEHDIDRSDSPKEVAWHLHAARGPDKPSAQRALDLAVRKLSKAFARGDVDPLWEPELDKSIPVAKRCEICRWRKKNRRWSPRCATCGQWLKRHGTERPTYLDGISPQEAATKRRARGEGWGVA